MRKGLLTAALLAVTLSFSAVGCGGRTNPEPTPSEEHVYTITINNKEEMQAEWLSDGASRTLNLTITKDGVEQNVTEAVQDEELTLVSSDTAVASVMGRNVTPVGAGTATITATYGNASDSVNITITQTDPHGKSAEDPLSVAEALAVCEAAGAEGTSINYYVKGYVLRFTSNDVATNGYWTFYIGDAKDSTDELQCYHAAPAEGLDTSLVGEESLVIVAGQLMNYNDKTPELNAGTVVSSTQGYVPQVIESSFAEALTIIAGLGKNETTKDKYVVAGVITAVTFEYANGTMSYKMGLTPDDTTVITVYKTTVSNSDDPKTDMVKGAKVVATGFLQNYNGNTPEMTSGDSKYDGVYVYELTGIALDKEVASVYIGATATLVASPVPAGAELGTVAWASSDESVATVDGGVVTGVAAGTATITATAGEFSASCVVTVTAEPIPATAVELDQSALALTFPGNAATLVATVTPTNTTDTAVWSSDNEAVATVADGVVTPVAVGTANITVKYNDDASATCAVTVSAATLGSEEHPLGVAELKEIAPFFCAQTNGSYADEKAYVTGVVTSVSYGASYSAGKYTITIADLENSAETIKITGVDYTGSEQAIFQNDVIVVHHYLEYYNGWALYFKTVDGNKLYGDVLSRTAGTSTITVEAEHATVTGLAATYVNDSTATFTVEVESGYQIDSVKAGTTALTADGSGNYSFVVKGNMTVTVTAIEAGLTTVKVTADFSAKTANHSSYSDTWTYGDFTISGGANNNGGWSFIKFGGKSATISAEGYPGTYVATNNKNVNAVQSVEMVCVPKCYNQATESCSVHVEAYSDAAMTTKIGESASQAVPAIGDGADPVTLTFVPTVGTEWAANSYYKVVMDVTNTTTYNGVIAVESISWVSIIAA